VDPTPEQAQQLAYFRESFGRSVVKAHAPDPKTGIMRVSLDSLAGVHEWYLDESGKLIDRSITMRLFDPPPPPHNPRNAIDN
jgi:hypothetical protein